LVAVLRELIADPERSMTMGANGRRWVEREASPQAVGVAYHQLIESLRR
jgi:hypothetical protein